MGKISDGIGRVVVFVDEVKTEMKKSAWPTRSELMESSLVIILAVLILGLFVGASDKILINVIDLLVK